MLYFCCFYVFQLNLLLQCILLVVLLVLFVCLAYTEFFVCLFVGKNREFGKLFPAGNVGAWREILSYCT